MLIFQDTNFWSVGVFSHWFKDHIAPQNKHGLPENGGPLEKEMDPIGNPSFPGSMLNSGGVLIYVILDLFINPTLCIKYLFSGAI